jgi:hypothetical protein
VVLPALILGSIDDSRAFHIAFSRWFITDIASGKNEEHAVAHDASVDGQYRAASVAHG